MLKSKKEQVKLMLVRYFNTNVSKILSTCNQRKKSLVRQKKFYTVFEIHCVFYTYNISIWTRHISSPPNPHVDSATVLDNPGFIVLVRTFMNARELIYFSVIGRMFLVGVLV